MILKAEARGSVEAIRKELEKLKHEEVTTRVLHAGIGAITESDVIARPDQPEGHAGRRLQRHGRRRGAEALAEERGISLREYDIIYKLTDDMKAALEGGSSRSRRSSTSAARWSARRSRSPRSARSPAATSRAAHRALGARSASSARAW